MLGGMLEPEKVCRKCGQLDNLVRWPSCYLCLRCRPIRPCLTCERVPPEVEFATPKAKRCIGCAAEMARAMRLSWRSTRRRHKPRKPAPHSPFVPDYGTRHANWVRHMPCCIGRPECRGRKIHAHHVRRGTGGGTGRKPEDRWCVPLCISHHMEGHQTGWQTFEKKYQIDLRQLAEYLASISPHLRCESVAPDQVPAVEARACLVSPALS